MTKPMPEIYPLPTLGPLSAPFWQGCNDGRLIIQRCKADGCGRFVHYPRVACPHCYRDSLVWQQVSGLGSVVTHTTIHRPHHESLDAIVPYVFAAVELDEGPILFARLKDADPSADLLGRAVRAAFETHEDARRMLVFALE